MPEPFARISGVSALPITAADLDVDRFGSGPVLILVHGSIVDGQRTWRHQRALGDEWTVTIPNRPGFGGSPALERGDFDLEAPLIAELLGDGAHLIGHSYGAVIALLVAGMRPTAVRSLIVSEPGLLTLAAGDPVVDRMIEQGELLYRSGDEVAPAEFLRHFRAGVHSTHETPDELPGWLERGARMAARERPPWEAEVPFEALAAAPFPKLVISGRHSPAFEGLCDVLAERIGAEREILAGRGHTIPATGEAYNHLVSDFMRRAEAARSGAKEWFQP
jgi:pimeloyl-ACP methyl ester carboxylesterase